MPFRSRESRSQDGRTRRRGSGLKPRVDGLESRQLLTAIDLANTPTAPFGVNFVGLNSPSGAGFSVANLGDVNGDGYDDFLVGAPVISNQTAFPALSQGNNNNSQVSLIFGSRAATASSIANWLALTPNDRVADLAQLGNVTQNNPINGTPQYPFDGLTFQLPSVQNAQLGASVAGAGDVNGDGFNDFLIGAPGAVDPTNPLNVSGGRTYLVYGSPNLATRTQTLIDLGNESSFNDIPIVTFINGQPNAQSGRAVAGIGDFLPDGIVDIAIGAPGATVNGITNSGAVFVISGAALRPATTRTIDLRTVGQTGGIPGVIYAGAAPGQGVGFSVAGPGDVDGRTPGQPAAADLLIGAPDTVTGLPGTANGPGRVYLAYGGRDVINQASNADGLFNINVGRLGVPSTGTNTVSGAVFVGDATNDLTGYSTGSGGDFNGDGLADMMLGAPGFANAAGRAVMIYGRSATSASGPIQGSFTLSNLPANVPAAQFVGGTAGDLAGYAVAGTGFVNNDQLNEVLVGAPGVGNGSGAAYLIPGNTDLQGSFSLNVASVQNTPVFATVITNSQPAAANLLGTSFGARTFQQSSLTADGDGKADFMIGAPGFSLNQARFHAGAGFALEGAFIPLATPVSTVITSAIGVDNKVRPPFVINPTTPADLSFYILSTSSNTPGFSPARDIDPTTITVNGLALPNPGSFQNAGDVDGDGIDDAVFTFSPRSDLGLTVGNQTVTIAARTLATSPLGDRRYRGSATVTVRSGPGPGPNPGPSAPLNFDGQFPDLNAAVPPYGERLLPTVNVLGRARWKPLPPSLAYAQFLPNDAFGARYRNFYHPIAALNRQKGKTIGGLTEQVFTRSRFPKGVYFGGIDHKGPTLGGGNVQGPYGVNLHRLPRAERVAQFHNLPGPRQIKTK